jgi:hypothetical protein
MMIGNVKRYILHDIQGGGESLQLWLHLIFDEHFYVSYEQRTNQHSQSISQKGIQLNMTLNIAGKLRLNAAQKNSHRQKCCCRSCISHTSRKQYYLR